MKDETQSVQNTLDINLATKLDVHMKKCVERSEFVMRMRCVFIIDKKKGEAVVRREERKREKEGVIICG